MYPNSNGTSSLSEVLVFIDCLDSRLTNGHWLAGGTAGSVLASRLTENPRFNVLVIEAGPTCVPSQFNHAML